MFIEIALPILTTILSLTAFIISIRTRRSNRLASRNIQHYGFVAQADIFLANNTECLIFHGIDPDTISEQYGVTSVELSYLLQLFNAGSISNLLSNEGHGKPFKKGSYYYDILRNEATQKAFPLLKLLFDQDNHFIARCKITSDSFTPVDSNLPAVKVD